MTDAQALGSWTIGLARLARIVGHVSPRGKPNVARIRRELAAHRVRVHDERGSRGSWVNTADLRNRAPALWADLLQITEGYR